MKHGGFVSQHEQPTLRWGWYIIPCCRRKLILDSVVNVVTDIMILCLPIRFVMRLQMKMTRKLQVLGAFGLGGMCVNHVHASWVSD